MKICLGQNMSDCPVSWPFLYCLTNSARYPQRTVDAFKEMVILPFSHLVSFDPARISIWFLLRLDRCAWQVGSKGQQLRGLESISRSPFGVPVWSNHQIISTQSLPSPSPRYLISSVPLRKLKSVSRKLLCLSITRVGNIKVRICERTETGHLLYYGI